MDTGSHSGRERVPELNDDERYQKRDWNVRRVAIGLFTLVLGAAVLGAFGGGPFSRVEAEAAGIRVEYERVTRRTAATELSIELAQEHPEGVTVELPQDFARAVRWHEGTTPLRIEHAADGASRLVFAKCDAGARLRLALRHPGMGRRSGTMMVGETPIEVATFVLP
jgi:hypothetical protein